MIGKIAGLFSLAASLFCAVVSEFHVPRLPPGIFGPLLYVALLFPWGYVAVFMSINHFNIDEYSSPEAKAQFRRRMNTLRKRFPIMSWLLVLVFVYEISRLFFKSESQFWLPHLFVSFFLFPAIALLRVFPRSKDLIAQWKRRGNG